MNQYSIQVDFDQNQIRELSAPYTVGELKHEEVFSWSPTVTHTNGEDSFFDVPMVFPTLGKSVKTR